MIILVLFLMVFLCGKLFNVAHIKFLLFNSYCFVSNQLCLATHVEHTLTLVDEPPPLSLIVENSSTPLMPIYPEDNDGILMNNYLSESAISIVLYLHYIYSCKLSRRNRRKLGQYYISSIRRFEYPCIRWCHNFTICHADPTSLIRSARGTSFTSHSPSLPTVAALATPDTPDHLLQAIPHAHQAAATAAAEHNYNGRLHYWIHRRHRLGLRWQLELPGHWDAHVSHLDTALAAHQPLLSRPGVRRSVARRLACRLRRHQTRHRRRPPQQQLRRHVSCASPTAAIRRDRTAITTISGQQTRLGIEHAFHECRHIAREEGQKEVRFEKRSALITIRNILHSCCHSCS